MPLTDLPATLAARLGATLYESSVVAVDEGLLMLLRTGGGKRLAAIAPPGSALLDRLDSDGPPHVLDGEHHALLGPLNARNAAALREALPWLRARPLGLQRSAGCGDRLGLATPAHARAVARTWEEGRPGMMPIFAQQSIRENSRTRRTPQEVMDDALWGVFEAGWRLGYGADADHLKTPADIDVTAAAGYTFFTVDPGEHVRSDAGQLDDEALRAAFEALPWSELDDSPTALEARYLDGDLQPPLPLEIDRTALRVAAVKYGGAVAHTAAMYRHLLDRRGAADFELEVSVDETDSPTSHLEHYYIARELKRLGVEWVSLAPRFVGRFEKGVDYQGDGGGLTSANLDRFRADFAGHVAIARALGPYKLSLHSGSDKFSIYPIAAALAGELVHLKTAGTSYLEALRAVARVHPALYRRIYRFAAERYPEDRQSYHVSAEAARMPDLDALPDEALPETLDQFDARQALHVTFGSVLNALDGNGDFRFKDELLETLRAHEAEHYATLEAHFERHLSPFIRAEEQP